MTRNADDPFAARAERLCGALLALTAILTLVAILHHPSLAGRHDVRQTAEAMLPLASMDRLVHGALMLLIALQTFGFALFGRSLGFNRLAVAAGLAAFAAGAVLMVIPTTLDGFVTPDLAQACLSAPERCANADAGAFRLVSIMIQDFTKVALILTAASTACWSSVLLTAGTGLRRVAGLVGLLCAVVPAGVLVFSNVVLRPDSLLWIMGSQILWTSIVAGLMIHRRDV